MSTTTKTIDGKESFENPDAKLIEDLKAFPRCKKTLSLPYTVLRYFVDDCAVYFTDLGYHFRKIENKNREYLFYDTFEDINNLTHISEISDSAKNRIAELEEMDKRLKPFNLFSMSYDEKEDEYLIFFEPSEVYITICAQDIPFISEITTEHLKGLGLNNQLTPDLIYLEIDGCVIE